MKKLIVAVGCVVFAVIALVIVERSGFIPFFCVMTIAPELISNETWRESIAKDPAAYGYSGYGILQDRGSDLAIQEGLRDLRSEDGYVWVNAAHYLGSRGHKEAIPYLIKALRHTAWQADDERVELLRQLTGETFGNSFDDWFSWYEAEPNPIQINWESSLGHAPRLPKKNREQDGSGQPATRSESNVRGGYNSQPESDGRSR